METLTKIKAERNMIALGESQAPPKETTLKARRPKTSSEAMAIEKRKAKNQLVESHLVTQPIAPAIDALLNSQAVSEQQAAFNKAVAQNANYALQPYDPKYDDEQFIKEIIRRDTGHVLALKTEATVPKKQQAFKAKAESIHAKDLEEMKRNKVVLPKYAVQMAELIKQSGIIPKLGSAEWEELADDLGLVEKTKQSMKKAVQDVRKGGRADDLRQKVKDSHALVQARADEQIWEKNEVHNLSRVDEVPDKPEEPAAKPKAVAKEDFFDEVAVGVDQANEFVEEKESPEEAQPEQPKASAEPQPKLAAKFSTVEEPLAPGSPEEQPEKEPKEHESDFEDLDQAEEDDQEKDAPAPEVDNDLEDLPINSDIDPRFLDDYEFKYQKDDLPPAPISHGPPPEPFCPIMIPDIPKQVSEIDAILEEMHQKRLQIQSKYMPQEGELEEKLRQMREKERELKQKWDEQRAKEEREKKASEKRIYLQGQGDASSAHQRILLSYDRIAAVKASVVDQDIHKAVEERVAKDKINSRFRHLEMPVSHVVALNPLDNAKDRMAKMLDHAEKKIENEWKAGANQPKPVKETVTSNPKLKPISDTKNKTQSILKKSPGKPSNTVPLREPPLGPSEMSEDMKKRIRDKLVKPAEEAPQYNHPWMDFD